MSVQAALAFMQQVRRDDGMAAEVAAQSSEALATTLPALGARHGYHFTAEELQRAFAHDWGMRWTVNAARRTPSE